METLMYLFAISIYAIGFYLLYKILRYYFKKFGPN